LKSFNIPDFYSSSLITRIKKVRQEADKRKKDLRPSVLEFNSIKFTIARHFGFCFGVENAIEICYQTIADNPSKKIYLLSEMIHNPEVNEDLKSKGLLFIQDTKGNQFIPWDEIKSNDIVIIPAFGTTPAIESNLIDKGIQIEKYNTTCPFVERVWNKSEKLGSEGYTVIIHGKMEHEETRATYARSCQHAKSIVIADLKHAELLSEFIHGKRDEQEWAKHFSSCASEGFNFRTDLDKIGVVNQTTMLAEDTQEITDFLASAMLDKFGEANASNHFANTRDTLCYATNDNQSATKELTNTFADIAIVVGGYNSSNTSHLVELCELSHTTYFIKNEKEILAADKIQHFDLHEKTIKTTDDFLPEVEKLNILITSGASCPDATVDRVIMKLLSFCEPNADVEKAIVQFEKAY
jgi:4-hydroxy-3-methylbut-2-enyl diphosphate reductase